MILRGGFTRKPGKNPTDGATFHVYFREAPDPEKTLVSVEILGANDEVAGGVVERHDLGDVLELVGDRRHQAEEERCIGHLIQYRGARGYYPVFNTKMRDVVVHAVTGSIPAVDRTIV